MSVLHDQALVESVRTHRARLAGAIVYGIGGTGRTVRSLTMRLIVGAVVAAIAAAACVGIGFISVALKTPASGPTAVVSPTASSSPNSRPTNTAQLKPPSPVTPASTPGLSGGGQ